MNNRMTFLNRNAKLRTDDEFRSRSRIYEDYQNKESILEMLPIDMVNAFPPDYLHFLLLGVVRWILKYTYEKSKLLSSKDYEEIKRRVNMFRKFQPREFQRRLRPFTEYLGLMKGTEFRQYVLFVAPVLFKGILSDIVPLVIKVMDVNDNAPIFEKPLYEFILSTDLSNFTAPAFIKAIDNDAEEPNNIIRYEFINGNYKNKFKVDMTTGQLSLVEPILTNKKNVRRRRQEPVDIDVFVLTSRAYDLGVPVMFSTATIRVYPPQSRVRLVTFLVSGLSPDRKKTEEMLSTITGGHVVIHNIRPYDSSPIMGENNIEKSIIVGTVLYDSSGVVDISKIQEELFTNKPSAIISSGDAEIIFRAENRVLFWLLIFLALTIAISILILLSCCICSWCPLYAVSRYVQYCH
ncbi:Cadherin-86C, partial [Pseudolycoriella hygida]